MKGLLAPLLLSQLSYIPSTQALAPNAKPSISFGVLPSMFNENVLPFTLSPPGKESEVEEKSENKFALFGRGKSALQQSNATDTEAFQSSSESFSLPKQASSSLRQRPARVTVINSGDEFLDYLKSDSRLVVVKFHAQWCSACKRFDFKYQKLAHDNSDIFDEKGNLLTASPVRFADVEYGKNRKLCKILGVDRLPCVQMYREGEGRLCSFACDPAKFNKVVDRMNLFLRNKNDVIPETTSSGR